MFDGIRELTNRIIVERNKTIDNMILGEIQKIATENGLETKIVINEKAVISALKKQIPKKIRDQKWIYTQCECGYDFSKYHGDGYYSIPEDKKTNYCPKCGQALDWSDAK